MSVLPHCIVDCVSVLPHSTYRPLFSEMYVVTLMIVLSLLPHFNPFFIEPIVLSSVRHVCGIADDCAVSLAHFNPFFIESIVLSSVGHVCGTADDCAVSLAHFNPFFIESIVLSYV